MADTTTNVARSWMAVGEYVLDSKIGAGAFGEVWKARHRSFNDHYVAVKIPTDPQFFKQLQSEGFSLHPLTHPNIVRVLGFDPGGQPPFLMMELVDGPSLREVLKKTSKLPPAHALAVMRQVLCGLAYAHSRGVVHGDLKPENVLVDKSAVGDGFIVDGTVKLTDFGVGRVAAAIVTSSSSRQVRSGQSGAVATPAYMAPEQREGKPTDARCDLFACGVILFELITGERPAGAECPSDLEPSSPPALDEFFRRAYTRRDRRFATADEMLAAIKAITVAPPSSASVSLGMLPDLEGEFVGNSLQISEETAPIVSAPAAASPAPVAPMYNAPSQPPAAAPWGGIPRQPAQWSTPSTPSAPSEPSAASTPARTPMRRNFVFVDELAKRPLRTAEELRALFRRIYLYRDLQPDELEPIKTRLDAWAEREAQLPNFCGRVRFSQAADTPYHRVSIITTYESSSGLQATEKSALMLANVNAGQDCSRVMEREDLVPFLHISAEAIPVTLLEMIPAAAMRGAINNLLNAARTASAGRTIERQELQIFRAVVLTVRFPMPPAPGETEATEQAICLAGEALMIVAPTIAIMRMRDEALKRCAIALDKEDIAVGIAELRVMLSTSGPPHPRAERMVTALRAKMSSAFLGYAKQMASRFAVMESLALIDLALELLPSNTDILTARKHAAVRGFWVQFAPGLAIGLVFAMFAYGHTTSPRLLEAYAASSIASIVTGLAIWYRMGLRPSRTDAAFCHACMMPLIIAGILATCISQFTPVAAGIASALLIILLIMADRWAIAKYGQFVLRQLNQQTIAGGPLDVLGQIQGLIEPLWDRLSPHYLSLEPLYMHAGAIVPEPDMPPQSNDDPPSLDDSIGDGQP